MEGLYLLEAVASQAVATRRVEVKENSKTMEANAVSLRSVANWHSRLGHWHDEGYEVKKKQEDCDVCLKGKSTRKGFPKKSEGQSTQPLELRHSDVMGKCVKSLGGNQYVVTYVDDYSRFTTVYFLKHKSEVFNNFNDYKAKVENNKTGRKIMIQTDGVGEYISHEFSKFLSVNGIVRRKTVRDSPEQNGIAERVNLVFRNCVRCMLLESGLPMSFWAEGLNYMCKIKNLCPSRAINYQIPLALSDDREVTLKDYENFRPFGCKGIIHVAGSSKFAARGIEYIFVGFEDSVKGFKVWIPSQRKFVTVHDVSCVGVRELV